MGPPPLSDDERERIDAIATVSGDNSDALLRIEEALLGYKARGGGLLDKVEEMQRQAALDRDAFDKRLAALERDFEARKRRHAMAGAAWGAVSGLVFVLVDFLLTRL